MTGQRRDDGATTVVVDDALRTALRIAIRALEEQVAAARASAELTGMATPDVTVYRDAAERLRAVVAV